MMETNIIIVLDALLDGVRDYFGATEAQIDELIQVFITKLPEKWKMQLKYE